jgi:hypothetical protein
MNKLNHPTFGELEQSSYGNWNAQVLSKEGRPIKISFDFHPLEAVELAKNAERHLLHVLNNELSYRKQMCSSML